MGQVGAFGPIVFETSDKRVLTPAQLKQDVSAQWGDHKLIGQKPKKEYIGAESRGLKFTIVLDAMLGIRPRQTMETLEWLIESGYHDYMVIGNKAIGDNQFYIKSMSEAWDVVYAGGEMARATLDITMEEYR